MSIPNRSEAQQAERERQRAERLAAKWWELGVGSRSALIEVLSVAPKGKSRKNTRLNFKIYQSLPRKATLLGVICPILQEF